MLLVTNYIKSYKKEDSEDEDTLFLLQLSIIQNTLTSMKMASNEDTLNPVIGFLCQSQGWTFNPRNFNKDAELVTNEINEATHRIGGYILPATLT